MSKLLENPLKVVTIRTLILTLIVDVIMYIILRDAGIKFIFGSSLGILTSLLGFHLINLSLKKSLKFNETKAALLHRRDQIFRNLLYMLVIVLSIKIDSIDTFTTVLGLLAVRMVIQSDSVLNWFKLFYKKEV